MSLVVELRAHVMRRAALWHTTLQSVESSVEVEHSYTLSDGDDGDQLQVAVYEDPIYGTAVFKTLSGMTMCPHENGTLMREGFKATVTKVSCPLSWIDMKLAAFKQISNLKGAQ